MKSTAVIIRELRRKAKRIDDPDLLEAADRLEVLDLNDLEQTIMESVRSHGFTHSYHIAIGYGTTTQNASRHLGKLTDKGYLVRHGEREPRQDTYTYAEPDDSED